MKLSFVVPIYNVEQYLRKCVDSLLHQDYNDYEIILVDDGSTDNSGKLADELSEGKNEEGRGKREEGRGKNGPEIRVIHQDNRGLSGARNTGIREAKGKYICFVDSDDYWEENVLRKLMAQIDLDNLDVLRFRWQNVREVRGKMGEVRMYEVFKPYKEGNFVDFSSEPLNGLDYLNQRMGIQCYAWSFIVRAEIVKGERLKAGAEHIQVRGEMFTEGILFEDTDWTPRMLVKANRVAGTDTIVYNYFWNDKGITLTKSSDKMKREVEDKLLIISRLKEWRNSLWYDRMISALTISIISILSDQLYLNRCHYLKQIQSMKLQPLSIEGLNRKAQRKAKIINISPRLAIWLIHNARH